MHAFFNTALRFFLLEKHVPKNMVWPMLACCCPTNPPKFLKLPTVEGVHDIRPPNDNHYLRLCPKWNAALWRGFPLQGQVCIPHHDHLNEPNMHVEPVNLCRRNQTNPNQQWIANDTTPPRRSRRPWRPWWECLGCSQPDTDEATQSVRIQKGGNQGRRQGEACPSCKLQKKAHKKLRLPIFLVALSTPPLG